jgi:WD40 repeat protein
MFPLRKSFWLNTSSDFLHLNPKTALNTTIGFLQLNPEENGWFALLLLLIRGAISLSFRHSNYDSYIYRILSGSYDSTLHLWSQKGTHLLTIPGHTGAVKAVAWVDIGETTSSFVR